MSSKDGKKQSAKQSHFTKSIAGILKRYPLCDISSLSPPLPPPPPQLSVSFSLPLVLSLYLSISLTSIFLSFQLSPTFMSLRVPGGRVRGRTADKGASRSGGVRGTKDACGTIISK